MDEPCYIIGGGSSLEGFDWDMLQGRNVLGCNVAFYIGANIVPITIFGDGHFMVQHRDGLDKYALEGGQVITLSNLISRLKAPEYIKQMKKVNRGLGVDGLGWNGNTGASAINLALLFGANPIYLLGFDMKLSPEGKKNYHNAYNDTPNAKVYTRFLKGMTQVARDLPQLFPGHQVINLEDGTSALQEFSKQSLKNHFSKELV
jgi:hypothetical protein